METGEALRHLADSILDSYELRVLTVNALMKQAWGFLRDYRMEMEEMILQLRENLSRSESLRKRDFDRMIRDILERRQQKEVGAIRGIERFQEEESEMVRRLRTIIERGGSSSLEDVAAIKSDILKRQKEREKDIIKALKQFQLEQEELKTALRRLLSKGEKVRIKEFRLMLKGLRARQEQDDGRLGGILEDLESVRERVQARWRVLSPASRP